MSLRMRPSAMTALAFLLTVVLATVTVGGTQTLLTVPQEPWGPICLAWLGVLSCAVLTLAGAWHVASGLLALAATRDEDIVSSCLGQALLRAVARRGAPAMRRTVAGTLLLGMATASPAAAQGTTPGDDLGWSPTSSQADSPAPEQPAAPQPGPLEESAPDGAAGSEGSSAQGEQGGDPGQDVPSQPAEPPVEEAPAPSPGDEATLRPAQPRPSELVPPNASVSTDAAAPAGAPHGEAGPAPAPLFQAGQATQGADQRATGHRPASPRPQERPRSPHPSQSHQATPQAGSRPTVTVEPGDSLWQITRRLLQAAKDGEVTDAEVLTSWPELYALNVAVIGPDPSLIHPGTVLTVPASLRG